MPDAAVVPIALLSATSFAAGLVLSGRGLRHLPPLRGACVSVPTAALLMLAASPFTLGGSRWHPAGALVFAVLGVFFPASVTLLTFAATRRLGASMTGALGNTAPLLALLFAALVLGEVPAPGQLAAAGVIVAGVTVLSLGGGVRAGGYGPAGTGRRCCCRWRGRWCAARCSRW